MPSVTRGPRPLIVNADDFGYFPHVTSGIMDCVRAGRVTAFGVMVTCPDWSEVLAQVRDCTEADVGAHLTVTSQRPITRDLQRCFDSVGGAPRPFALVRHILIGRIPLGAILAEWRAQLDRLLSAGVDVWFVNSHEHIHMLPGLLEKTIDMVAEYGIPHVRRTTPDVTRPRTAAGAVRGAILRLCAALAPPMHAPTLLGLQDSGRLNSGAIGRLLEAWTSDAPAELMCHPGNAPPPHAALGHLLTYHQWTTERDALLGDEFVALLARNDCRLARYRDLSSSVGTTIAAKS